MDALLEEYLKKINVKYLEHKHQAVFTIEEANHIKDRFNFIIPKNLLLTDTKGNFFLYCLPGDKRAPLSLLKKHLEVSKLLFASPSELLEQLNLEPGHVSIFALIRNPRITLLLEKSLFSAPLVGFHPNINTATLELTHEEFVKFYNSLPNRKEVVELA